MAGYSTAQLTFVIEQYILRASSITVQRAYNIKFSTLTAPSGKVIKRCVKNFYATGNISPLKQSRRPTTAWMLQNIQLVKDIVEANPKASVQRIAQQVGICQRSTHAILKKDMSLKSYKIQVIQKLEPQDYEKRKPFASWFINQCEVNPNLQRRLVCQMKHTFVLIVPLTSETVEFGLNIIHKLSSQHLFTLRRITVWCAVTAQEIIRPYFFEDHSGNAVT